MNHFLLFLLLFHVMADFSWKSNALHQASQHSVRWLLLHCAIYTVALFIPMFFLGFLSIGLSAIVAAALGVLHFITDSIKRTITIKHDSPKTVLVSFIVDQSMHMMYLWMASLFVQSNIATAPWFAAIPDMTTYVKGIQLLTAMLIGYKPAAILVKLVLDTLPLLAMQGEQESVMTNSTEEAGAGGGRLIGILERGMIILLAFMQQFGAIGFVLAAKSIARYKQLEQQSFAEKYLVGTLSSALIALFVSLLIGKL